MSDNNPDIADLSDNYRPTKIAERYQELYDNQWTDAFETVVKHYIQIGETNPEQHAIERLRKILLVSLCVGFIVNLDACMKIKRSDPVQLGDCLLFM